MILHGYFRSSASWRVRIALGLKGLSAQTVSHHLRKGEQRASDFLGLNPQGLVPALVLDNGAVLTQSLAMIEYLDETHPEPALLPKDALRRAKVRAFAEAIACDLHPVQNLKVLQALRAGGFSEDAVNAWARQVNAEGLDACEKLLADEQGPFCFGATPTLADICLVPQMYNARRFNTPLDAFPTLTGICASLEALPAFAAAKPEVQADAPR